MAGQDLTTLHLQERQAALEAAQAAKAARLAAIPGMMHVLADPGGDGDGDGDGA